MAVSVMVALADFEVSATDVAVSVTVAGLGNTPGAVNVIGVPDPLVADDKLPHEDPPHSEPESAQLTPLLEGSPITVAVRVVVAFTGTVAVVGATDTEIPAGVVAPIVIVAEAYFVPSLTDVAVIVTVGGLGTVAGAVKVTGVPDALDKLESAPQAAPVQPVPDNTHVTPLF